MSVGRCDLSPGIQDDAPLRTRYIALRTAHSLISQQQVSSRLRSFRRVKACKSANLQGLQAYHRPASRAYCTGGHHATPRKSSFLLVRSPPSPNFPASPPPVLFSMLAIAFSPSPLPLAIVHSHELLHADLAADTRLVSSARR
ncbi:hypothetical protein E4U61_004154 [Claviceps capensis]|nr:hypothetical protein E4U61_004154 [Claviceps capensis]